MKANELMVCDLIYLVHGPKHEGPDWYPGLFPDENLTETREPIRITGTEHGRGGIISWEWKDNPDKYSFWASYGKDLDWLEPIPLTTEILARNGFQQQQGIIFDEYSVEGWYILNIDDHGEIIRIGVDETYNHLKIGNTSNDNCWMSVSIYYVHQMQHILRFLGLYDLANEFKV